MAQQNQMSVPGPFGGLVRYDSEYDSKFKMTPTQVLIFAALVVVAVTIFKVFWTVA